MSRPLVAVAIFLTAMAAIGAVGIQPFPGAKGKKRSPAEKDPVRGVDRSKEAITGFFKSRSVEEMAEWVRKPERALPRMKAYYAGGFPGPVKITFGEDWREHDMGRRLMVYTPLEINFRTVTIVTEVPRAGPALVDWESYEGWCEIPWSQFLKEGTAEARTFRVTASNSDYYNFRFNDEKKFACFQLTDKADEQSVYAYCERDTELHKTITARLRDFRDAEDKTTLVPCMFKLTMTGEDISRRQAKIADFMQSGWVEP